MLFVSVFPALAWCPTPSRIGKMALDLGEGGRGFRIEVKEERNKKLIL